MSHSVSALAAMIALVGGLGAQAPDLPQAGARASLVAAQRWSMQAEPLRFTLRLEAGREPARIRVAPSRSRSWLHPFEVEREVDGQWVAVAEPDADGGRRGYNPARMLTGLSGRVVNAGLTVDLEAELWRVAVVATPGKLRVRLPLQTRPATSKQEWQPLPMPWATVSILAHPGNAEVLLTEDAASLARQYELICQTLNSTMRALQNDGPVSFGPAGPAWRSENPWGLYQKTCDELLAQADLSWRVRARARLARAYYGIEEARCGRDVDGKLLRRARADLESQELTAPAPGNGLWALPSGGLKPMQLMLTACAESGFGAGGLEDRQRAHAEIFRAYPFFAYWWKAEADRLLLR